MFQADTLCSQGLQMIQNLTKNNIIRTSAFSSMQGMILDMIIKKAIHYDLDTG